MISGALTCRAGDGKETGCETIAWADDDMEEDEIGAKLSEDAGRGWTTERSSKSRTREQLATPQSHAAAARRAGKCRSSRGRRGCGGGRGESQNTRPIDAAAGWRRGASSGKFRESRRLRRRPGPAGGSSIGASYLLRLLLLHLGFTTFSSSAELYLLAGLFLLLHFHDERDAQVPNADDDDVERHNTRTAAAAADCCCLRRYASTGLASALLLPALKKKKKKKERINAQNEGQAQPP